MKIYSAFVVILCLIAMALLPFPLKGQGGVYNTYSGLYWCERYDYCLHEIGHKLDQGSGWKSQTQDFRDAIRIFIGVESRLPNPSPFLRRIFEYPNFTMIELYAQIFALSDGKRENMPEIFRPFYDWQLAEQYLKDLR
jgi:hypothetical protein